MIAPNVIIISTDEMKQMLALLQSIQRKADQRGDVEIVELAERCAKLAEDALDQ